MRDLLVLAMTVGFFALCVAYVALCNRIVGPDEPATEQTSVPGSAAIAVTPIAVTPITVSHEPATAEEAR